MLVTSEVLQIPLNQNIDAIMHTLWHCLGNQKIQHFSKSI